MTASDRFYHALLNSADGRVRVEQAVLWRALREAHPEQAVTTAARVTLRDLLDQMFINALAEAPKGRQGWDQSAKPILPKWIRLPRSRSQNVTVDLRSIPWAPELRFLSTIRTSVPVDDLLKLQRFFAENGRALPIVPIKERSIHIFGDEKRLDEMYSGSNFFNPGRLTLAQLRCCVIAEPLGWRRGPSPEAPVIVIENVSTWHSYCRWNQVVAQFSAVIYGAGNRFIDGVRNIEDIYQEIGGTRRILYFGDVDANGLNIPQRASEVATNMGLPGVEPHLDSYRWLLELGPSILSRGESEITPERPTCEWLSDLAEQAWTIISAGNRVAQERLGWQHLQSKIIAQGCIAPSAKLAIETAD